MTSKEKRRTKIYWISLLIYTVIISIAAAVGLKYVWAYAEEYEASRVGKVIDAYVLELSENLMSDEIKAEISSMEHPVQTDEEIQQIVKQMLKNGVTYQRKGSSDNGSVVTYNLLCNGKPFGEVTVEEDLSKAGEVKFGMLPWKIKGSSFNFSDLYHTLETVAPADYTVLLNGVPLDKSCIVEEGIEYDVLSQYYNEYPDLPTKVRYSYDKAIGDLEFTYKDKDGNDTVIDPDSDDSQFVVECSEEQAARLSEFGTRFADRYLKFSCGLTGIGTLVGYVPKDSELWSRMELFAEDGVGYSHTSSFRLDSCDLNGAVELGGGYYLCDMTANTTITYTGKGNNGVVENVNNMKFICHDDGENIVVVSLELY